jgi:hypothetical protein
MKKSNFALRLQTSLMEEAKKVAKAEGVPVNQRINVAVAEKVSALRTEEYFAERAARGDIQKALQVLKRRASEIHLFLAFALTRAIKRRASDAGGVGCSAVLGGMSGRSDRQARLRLNT